MFKGKIKKIDLLNSLYANDGRRFTTAEVIEIFYNTKTNLLNKDIKIPIKEGHFTPSERVFGYLKGVNLTSDKYKNVNYYKIIGTLLLDNEVYDNFKNGYYSSISVEIWPYGFNPLGGEYGLHIGAVAVVGSNPPAFDNLIQYNNKEGVKCLQMRKKKMNTGVTKTPTKKNLKKMIIKTKAQPIQMTKNRIIK